MISEKWVFSLIIQERRMLIGEMNESTPDSDFRFEFRKEIRDGII